MSDHKLDFKISNIPDSFSGFLIFISVLLFICGGGVLLASSYSVLPEWTLGPFVLLILVLGFGSPFMVMAGMKTNVSYDGKHVKLKSFFNKSEINLEHVKSVRYWHERGTGRSRGFGFVDMPNADEANAAIAALNGKEILGRPVRANEAKPLAPR